MGSVCAVVRNVVGMELIECEVQNEGWIYENQTMVFDQLQSCKMPKVKSMNINPVDSEEEDFFR